MGYLSDSSAVCVIHDIFVAALFLFW